MSFQNVVIGPKTFTERNKGVYQDSSLVIGSPANEIRLKPSNNPKAPSVAITRYQHIVVPASAGLPERRVPIVATLQITMPAGEPTITATHLNSLVQDLAAISSIANLNRLFLGES